MHKLQTTKPLEIVHLDMLPHEDNILERYRIFFDPHWQFFEEGVGVHVEVQRSVLEEVQKIQSL